MQREYSTGISVLQEIWIRLPTTQLIADKILRGATT